MACIGARVGCGDCKSCQCTPQIVAQWTGYRELNPDLRNWPDFDDTLADQFAGTSLIWRIVYDETVPHFQRYIHENKLTWDNGITPDLGSASPYDNPARATYAQVQYTGPVRGYQLCGLPTAWDRHHWVFDLAAFGFVPVDLWDYGRGGVWSWWTGVVDGLPNATDLQANGYYGLDTHVRFVADGPFGPTIYFRPENWRETAAMPWRLELGCVRCHCQAPEQIFWPSIQRIEQDVTYDADGHPWPDVIAMDSVVSRDNSEYGRVVTDQEWRSRYWAGDTYEPLQSPPCPPDVIVWSGLGKGLPPGWQAETHGLTLNEFAPAYTAQQIGNPRTHRAFGFLNQPDTFVADGAVQPVCPPRHETFATADVFGVDWIVLVGDYRHGIDGYWNWPVTGVTADDLDGLTDWLTSGARTLVIDSAVNQTATCGELLGLLGLPISCSGVSSATPNSTLAPAAHGNGQPQIAGLTPYTVPAITANREFVLIDVGTGAETILPHPDGDGWRIWLAGEVSGGTPLLRLQVWALDQLGARVLLLRDIVVAAETAVGRSRVVVSGFNAATNPTYSGNVLTVTGGLTAFAPGYLQPAG